MTTLILFDVANGGYRQAFVNEEVVESVYALVPHDYSLLFIIQDEVEVLDNDGNPIEELTL